MLKCQRSTGSKASDSCGIRIEWTAEHAKKCKAFLAQENAARFLCAQEPPHLTYARRVAKRLRRRFLTKSQMTVFVVLGIVALFMFGVMYFILSGTERVEQVDTRERLQGQVRAVEGYVTSCLVRTAGNALLKLGRQGGLRFPCDTKCCLKGDCNAACCAKDGAGNDVAYGALRPSGSAGPYKADPPLYPFDLGSFAYPWLASGGIARRITTPLFLGIPKLLPRDRPAKNSIQEQLEDEVAATLPQCLNLRTAFSALNITTGQPNVSVAFGNATHASTATNFMLTFPVTISSEAAGAVYTKTLYAYKAPFAFDKIYEDVSHIIQEDIKDMLYDPAKDAAVQRQPGRPDDIIRLDTQEELNNEKFYLQFGRENRRPALECVGINRDCHALTCGVGAEYPERRGGGGRGTGEEIVPIGPSGIAVDAGNIYFADTPHNRTVKLSSTGALLAKWGSTCRLFGVRPLQGCVDPDGDGPLEIGDGQFSTPVGVAVDKNGSVYVADTHNHRIQKFDSNGKFLAKWGTRGNGDGEFEEPYGVGVDKDGNIYVTDSLNHRIQKFDSNRQFITKWGSEGEGGGQFAGPDAVTIDKDMNVYVVDVFNFRIQKFDANGRFLTTWGTMGDGIGQFWYPWGVAVDNDTNIYVTDPASNRTQVFTSTGTFITSWTLNVSPLGIAVDADRNVFLAEYLNSTIEKFNNTGTFLAKFGPLIGMSIAISPPTQGFQSVDVFPLTGMAAGQWTYSPPAPMIRRAPIPGPSPCRAIAQMCGKPVSCNEVAPPCPAAPTKSTANVSVNVSAEPVCIPHCDPSGIQYPIKLYRQSGGGVIFSMFLLDRTKRNASLVIIPRDCNGNDGFSTGILGGHASSSHKFTIPGIPFSGKIVLALVDDSINVKLNCGAAYSSGSCADYGGDDSHPKCTKKCAVLKPNADVLKYLWQGENTMDIDLCSAKGSPDGFAELVYAYRIPLAAQDADEDDIPEHYNLVYGLEDESGNKLGNGVLYSPKQNDITGDSFTFRLAVHDEDTESKDWQDINLPIENCAGGVVGGAPNVCVNGKKDGQESDIDCGGTCPRCVAGRACDENSDCLDGPCDDTAKKCGGTPKCDDAFKNGDETDKDCGGSCPKCGLGKKCSTDADCVTSTHCISNVCSPPTPAQCLNGIKDGSETDEDCGGSCPKCTFGKTCVRNSDCSSDICTGGKCAAPPHDCTNGLKDGDETDVDCGGNTCPACPDGKACIDPAGDDCESNKCENFVCISCTDNVQNGDETDQDCGGSCSQCADGKSCSGSSDCQSGNCNSGTCA